MNASTGSYQKEKADVTTIYGVGGTTSLTSSFIGSMQHQSQIAANQRSNSLPKTPAASGVGSPASISNLSVP